MIVHSSCLYEDTQNACMAGKFGSVANVCGTEAFQRAVNQVIASYNNDNEEKQVLVQSMLSDVAYSGIAFTLDPNTGENY